MSGCKKRGAASSFKTPEFVSEQYAGSADASHTGREYR